MRPLATEEEREVAQSHRDVTPAQKMATSSYVIGAWLPHLQTERLGLPFQGRSCPVPRLQASVAHSLGGAVLKVCRDEPMATTATPTQTSLPELVSKGSEPTYLINIIPISLSHDPAHLDLQMQSEEAWKTLPLLKQDVQFTPLH